ncbi:MAG: PAS domain S-box protein, partial [Hydrogenophilaceae bacterium]
SPLAPPDIAPLLQDAARQTVADRRTRLVGPYRDQDGRLRLDFLALLAPAGVPPALVVLETDPTGWLYRTLQAWPTPSASSETLIFRRDGDQVLFLNELRFRPGSAAETRQPLATNDLLAAQVLRGETEPGRPIEGEDYRRVAVLGVAQAIPGTDWFLIAKVDRAELYGDASRQAIWIGLSGMLALFTAAAVLYLVRQRQQFAIAEDLRQSQEARLRSLQLLTAITDSSDDAIFAKDLEGRYILFNQAASRFVGKPAEAVLGLDDHALFPADQAEMLMATGRRVVAEDRLNSQEETLSTPNGERVFLSTKGPLRDADGQVIGIFGISRDITERNQAETALRDSEGRFRALVEQSLAGIYIIQDDRFAYVNPGFAAIFGYDSPAALIDRVAVTDLVSPDDRALVAENVRRRMAGETSDLHYTFTGLRRDGSTIVVEVHGRAFSYRGRPAVIGLILDITARKAAEDSLRASELRFHDIVQASADWVWEVDPEGRYTYVSDSVQAILGYTPAEILGKTPFDLMPPEEAARVGRLFADIAARRTPFRDLDNLNRHKDGSLHHVQTSGMPILGTDGALLGYRGLDRDVTESKRAERMLHQRNEELERFNRATVGRELDMIELKKHINELSIRLGLEPPYPLSFVDAPEPDDQGQTP